jgi:stage II sporulation protein D
VTPRAGRARAYAVLALPYAAASVLACAPAPVRVDRSASAPPAPPAPPAAVTRGASSAGTIDEGGRIVRVALAQNSATARVSATAGEWRVYDVTGRSLVLRVSNGSAAFERKGAQLRAVDGRGVPTVWQASPLVARALTPGTVLTYGGKRYRGELWLHADGKDGVTVVNRLPVEDYLRGVVPLELGTSASSDAAALQAQAVAARSYVYVHMPEFEPAAQAVRNAARAFDVRSSVSDQVYGGIDAEQRASSEAIDATQGLVLRYAGAVVSGPYSSTCGGSTAEAPEVWRSPGQAYLRRVSDRVPGSDRHYCDIAPRFRWTRTYEAPALAAVVDRYLRQYAAGAGSARAGEARPGAVRALTVDERTPSGRVGILGVSAEGGRYTLRGNDIRFVLRSAGGDILPSTYFSVEPVQRADGRLERVTLRGQGNGHGIGMCQWGAIGRSRAGQDFRTILRTYYPGTTVERVD